MAYFLSLLRSEAIELAKLTGKYLLAGLIFFLCGLAYALLALVLNLNNALSFSFCLVVALITAQLSWNYLAGRRHVSKVMLAATSQNVERVGTSCITAVTGAVILRLTTTRSADTYFAVHLENEVVKRGASTSADISLVAA